VAVLVTLAIVVLLAFWGVGTYNRLMRIRNQVLVAWRQIDTQLKRRHELIATLVTTVRSTTPSEPETLDAVASARSRAMAATGPGDSARREAELTEALGRVLALVEQSALLESNQHLRAVHEELSSTAQKVGVARQSYNDLATKYNTAIEVIPNNFVAGFGNFKRAELFEADT
jgi:LemA protein